MFASVLRATVGLRRSLRVRRDAASYHEWPFREAAERFQVERFNTVWAYCLSGVPFYQSWAREHGLPEQITTVSDLRRFPVLTKAVMMERSDEAFQEGKIALAYSTGGSTGTPTRYPRGQHDTASMYANTYVGRSWWGVSPFDSYVHVWGHSHLFGGGKVQKLKRAVLDRLANATRVNAYDLSEGALASHAQAILRRNPSYVVGYTSAIFKIARHIETQGLDVSGLSRLRAMIVTAETVSRADVDLIGRVFGVPVVIEYGAAETGVMATSRGGSWPLQVLWRSFIVHAANDGNLTVTTLDDRLFPLINYMIGDVAESGDVVDGNALTLGAVTGRSQDVVTVTTHDGGQLELSPILPIHILKGVSGVAAVQYRQEGAGRLRIFLAADRPLPLGTIAETFTSTLQGDHSGFDPASVTFEQVDRPLLTLAGKQALFV